MKKIAALAVLLLSGCSSQSLVRRVQFSSTLDMSQDQVLACAYIRHKKELTCFDPIEAYIMIDTPPGK
jgi:uncharacterized protein YcfL